MHRSNFVALGPRFRGDERGEGCLVADETPDCAALDPGHACSGDFMTNHLATATASSAPASCADDEGRHVRRRNAGEGIGQRPRDGDGGVCEGCRGGEPVGRGDVEPDRVGDCRAVRRDTSENRQQQPERRHAFREPLARPACAASAKTATAADRTSDARASTPAMPPENLARDVHGGVFPRQLAAQRERQRHRRIEMRAGQRAEHRISTTRIAPVGMVLHSSAIAPFPPASRCAMMPEPTTAASRNAVPSASAAARRDRSTSRRAGLRGARPACRSRAAGFAASCCRAPRSAARRRCRCAGSACGRRP